MGYSGDLKLVEGIQRRWTRAISSLEQVGYEQRLRELNLYSMYGRLVRADLILVWRIFNGLCAIKPKDLFQVSSVQGTRGHSRKLQFRQCRLDTRKRFFSFRVVPLWNSLSAEAVEASSLATFKAFLHRDLGGELFRVI